MQISEVLPAPSEGNEWLELFNETDTAIDLTGWQLLDQLSQPSLMTTLDQIIEGQTYLIIELTTAKLNNSADGVTLKNSAGEVVATMSYNSSSPDLSWSLIGTTYELTEPTPNQANQVPQPLATPLPTPTLTPIPSPSPMTPQTSLDTLPSPPIYRLPNIKLQQIVSTPISTPAGMLVSTQANWPIWPLLGVILGGCCLLIASWQIYEKTGKNQTVVSRLDATDLVG